MILFFVFLAIIIFTLGIIYLFPLIFWRNSTFLQKVIATFLIYPLIGLLILIIWFLETNVFDWSPSPRGIIEWPRLDDLIVVVNWPFVLINKYGSVFF